MSDKKRQKDHVLRCERSILNFHSASAMEEREEEEKEEGEEERRKTVERH